MKERPISVTVIGWILIVMGGVSLISNLAIISNPMALDLMGKSPVPIPVQFAMTYIGLLIMIVAGIAIFKGCNWARLLFVIWSVVGFAVGIITSPTKAAIIPGFVVFLIIVIFLFRPVARVFFAKTPIPLRAAEQTEVVNPKNTCKTNRWKWFWCSLLIWMTGWSLYLIPEWARPVGNHEWTDVSGGYVVSKKDGHGETRIGYPFVNYDLVDEGAMVVIAQTGDQSLAFSYPLNGGYGRRDDVFVVTEGQPRCQWLEKSFVYFEKKIRLCGILPGLTTSVCESRVTKCMDGTLQLANTQTQRGLVLFLVPFSETYRTSMVLQPVKTSNTNCYPALIGRVSDHAHVLSSNQVEQLTAILSACEDRTTAQIAVFTVESIRPATNIAVYGTALANHYGIGTREKNNGIVFLVATKDREMRLAVGLGLENAIPDSVAATIINDRVQPLFKQGRMYDGIVVCIQAVIACLDHSTANIPPK